MKKSVKFFLAVGAGLSAFFFSSSAFAAYTGEAGSFSGHTGPASVCSLGAIPNNGTVPFTVTLTGRTFKTISPGLVEAYNNIDWGDGTFSGAVTGAAFGPLHARFQAKHTYVTPGIFPISNYMIYATDPNYTWVDKNASARCSFKSITVRDRVNSGVKAPFCGNNIVETGEQCDEGPNNGLPGSSCSTTCTFKQPECKITVTPTSGTVPLSVVMTATGFGGAVSSIYWGDSTSTPGPWSGTAATGISIVAPHTYTASGTYTISMTITNIYSLNHTKTCTAKVVAMGVVEGTGDGPKGPFCGNGVMETGEQCDAGVNNGMPGYGCSSTCTLLIPKCDATVSPTSGPIPLSVVLITTGFGGRILSIDRTDSPVAVGPWMGTPVPGTPYTSFVTGHTYTTVGTFGVIVTMFNPEVPNLTRKCTTSVMTRAGKATGNGTGVVVINPTTGSNVTGAVNTGVVVPAPTPTTASFGNITPAIVKNISNWAYRYGITQLPLSDTQMVASLTRYGLADMFVRFVKNVKKQPIARNAACDITKFSDYNTFTTDMRTTITAICDLGLMGLSTDQKSLIRTFDTKGAITADQLKTIINRYQPGMILPTATLQTRNLDFLLHLFLIASKK